jgi:ferredoxin
MKKPWVDQAACTGCGLCVNNVSEVFRLKDHDKAEVYDPGGAYEATIQQEAIDICPVSCIQWLE